MTQLKFFFALFWVKIAILYVSYQALDSMSKLECRLEDQVSKSADFDHITNTGQNYIWQAKTHIYLSRFIFLNLLLYICVWGMKNDTLGYKCLDNWFGILHFKEIELIKDKSACIYYGRMKCSFSILSWNSWLKFVVDILFLVFWGRFQNPTVSSVLLPEAAGKSLCISQVLKVRFIWTLKGP